MNMTGVITKSIFLQSIAICFSKEQYVLNSVHRYGIWNCPGRIQSWGQFYTDCPFETALDMCSRPKLAYSAQYFLYLKLSPSHYCDIATLSVFYWWNSLINIGRKYW